MPDEPRSVISTAELDNLRANLAAVTAERDSEHESKLRLSERLAAEVERRERLEAKQTKMNQQIDRLTAERDELRKAFNIGARTLEQAVALYGDTEARLRAAEVVVEAAKAEVLAQGYRSSDMARALEALEGELWFENYVPPLVPSSKQVCGYKVTTEMDDGPLTQVCSLPPHGSERDHHFAAALAEYHKSGASDE